MTPGFKPLPKPIMTQFHWHHVILPGPNEFDLEFLENLVKSEFVSHRLHIHVKHANILETKVIPKSVKNNRWYDFTNNFLQSISKITEANKYARDSAILHMII